MQGGSRKGMVYVGESTGEGGKEMSAGKSERGQQPSPCSFPLTRLRWFFLVGLYLNVYACSWSGAVRVLLLWRR